MTGIAVEIDDRPPVELLERLRACLARVDSAEHTEVATCPTCGLEVPENQEH